MLVDDPDDRVTVRPPQCGGCAAALGVRDAADRLGPFVDRVRMLLCGQPVIGADETPAWVDGGWKYVHVACTEKLTLLHAGSRSKADIDAGGFLPGFTGVLVRNGYAGYDHIRTATHAECVAHLRTLMGVHEVDPAKLQLKISATWRSLQGLADFATLRSYLSTAGKHGQISSTSSPPCSPSDLGFHQTQPTDPS